MRASDHTFDLQEARRRLEELHQLEREIAELRQVRRVDALDGARDAVRRIGEVGSPDGILSRAPEELGIGSGFDRLLISQVRDGSLLPHAMWLRDDPVTAGRVLAELRATPIALEYPLIEEEVARRQQPALVDVGASGPRSPRRLAEAMSWDSYVVVALTLHGATVGLLHADAFHSGRAVDSLDREVASLYAEGLAGAFERATLRKTLQRHRDELRTAVEWMSRRLEGTATAAEAVQAPDSRPADPLVDTLTDRESQVLQLLIRGRTNISIAKTLVISEGTVKYHVKNILRKLQATSRADAVARYLREEGYAR